MPPTPIDFNALTEDDKYLVCVGEGVWLMDNHRWALKVWETEHKHGAYTLVHADYHWDGIYDFHDSPDEEAKLLAATPEDITRLVDEGNWIRFDSFIAPAIRRGLIHTVHFFCLQQDEDEGIEADFMASCGATQVLHSSASELASISINGPLIFDLCLDLFNHSDEQLMEGDLWEDDEIMRFIETLRPLITQAEIVTVSMSFGYSGTPEDTQHLTQLVIPALLEQRRTHAALA